MISPIWWSVVCPVVFIALLWNEDKINASVCATSLFTWNTWKIIAYKNFFEKKITSLFILLFHFTAFHSQDCELFLYHPKAKFNTSKIKNTRQQQQHKLHITKQHITTASKNFGGRKKESIERGISNKSNTA